ncbi:heat shock protein 75 kDa, mitochondrial-like [Antedon mediterranea]|uniref:heat shock protein 75 kDa, mitochondrial-like n=1 Tax=Antedon mediterranea TaxID=105859 RepID=UPI003AF44EFD
MAAFSNVNVLRTPLNFLKQLRCSNTIYTRGISKHCLQSTHNLKYRSKLVFSPSSVSVSSSRQTFTNKFNFSRCLCSNVATERSQVITDTEEVKGEPESHEFQSETKMLLKIVAQSLYSEKEVFIREIISNASDALQKRRYLQLTNEEQAEGGEQTLLEIRIKTDSDAGTFTIQDTGVGMTKEDLIKNLGTIAMSGSKSFLEKVEGKSYASDIIGQFGVGFYSTFMVGDSIDVFTRSQQHPDQAYKWSSDGSGKYSITDAEGVQFGTKIVIKLKSDSWKFSVENDVKDIISKHNNFVGFPIYLNGEQLNTQEALWSKDSKSITEEDHKQFYQFISRSTHDKPRFTLHYKTDAPINIQSVFYIPERPPAMWEFSQEYKSGVALYCRKVLIQSKADKILPKWLRFIVGVVDSEDIPLNLSREILQDSTLLRKLSMVLTSKIVKFLVDNSAKDPAGYDAFFDDYGTFLREGIVSSGDQIEKEEIAKLLRYESSALEAGVRCSLQDYSSRMKAGQRSIFYIVAPNRELAETSPYYEGMKKLGMEVLFCFDDYDELVMLQLREFDKKVLTSAENELLARSNTETDEKQVEGSLSVEETDSLIMYLKDVLGDKVLEVKATGDLGGHPAMITVQEMGAARHFLKTALKSRSEEEQLQILRPTLQLNTKHNLLHLLSELKSNNPALARMLTDQIFDNAMIAAGLVTDPRTMLGRLNTLLERILTQEK